MLTDDIRRTVLSRFPDIKLSYDKTLHNKVYADLFLIVPKGPKAFLWFTYVNNNVAIILLLNKKYPEFGYVSDVFSSELSLERSYMGRFLILIRLIIYI